MYSYINNISFNVCVTSVMFGKSLGTLVICFGFLTSTMLDYDSLTTSVITVKNVTEKSSPKKRHRALNG